MIAAADRHAGRIVQVIGSTFDAEFEEGHLPEIYNALRVDTDVQGVHIRLTGEVQQHLGGNRVRCVALGSTDGLVRGMQVTAVKATSIRVLLLAVWSMSLLPLFDLADGPPLRTGPETEKRFPALKVPTGFKATLFACDPLVEYSSAIAIGPRPHSVFVAADYMTGLGTDIVQRDEIRLIEDTDGDGYADKSTVYADSFNSIEGLTFHDGTVYAMHAPLLTALRDGNGDGKADQRQDLVTGLGLPPEKNPHRLHCANGVVMGHDGWLYLALGDRGCCDRIGRRDDRAQRSGERPGHSRHERHRDDRDDGGAGGDQPDRERADVLQVRPKVADRGQERSHIKEWRQHDQEDDLGVEFERRDPRDESDDQTADEQKHGVRDVDPSRDRDEDRHHQEECEEQFGRDH